MSLDTTIRRAPSADLKTHLREPRPVEAFIARDGFDETPTNRDVNQTDMCEDLFEDLGPRARLQHQQDVSQLAGRIPTTSELNQEFQKLAADKTVPFEYIADGCYARAHVMCDQLHQDNVNTAKMFVMLENPYGGGRLEAENKYMRAEWWYHVAPMVFARDEKTGEVAPYIMDPSMADEPMRAEDWVHEMWDERTPIKIDVTRDPQYGPVEESGIPRTFAESLPSARKDCAKFSAKLERIKEDYCGKHPGDCQGYLLAA